MTLVYLGAALMIAGVAVMTITTAKRGRLSEPHRIAPDAPRETLEPTGKGRRMSLRSDLPGASLVAIGALMILASAAFF